MTTNDDHPRELDRATTNAMWARRALDQHRTPPTSHETNPQRPTPARTEPAQAEPAATTSILADNDERSHHDLPHEREENR